MPTPTMPNGSSRRALEVDLLLARVGVPAHLEPARAQRRRQLALPQVGGLDDVSVGVNGLHSTPWILSPQRRAAQIGPCRLARTARLCVTAVTISRARRGGRRPPSRRRGLTVVAPKMPLRNWRPLVRQHELEQDDAADGHDGRQRPVGIELARGDAVGDELRRTGARSGRRPAASAAPRAAPRNALRPRGAHGRGCARSAGRGRRTRPARRPAARGAPHTTPAARRTSSRRRPRAARRARRRRRAAAPPCSGSSGRRSALVSPARAATVREADAR